MDAGLKSLEVLDLESLINQCNESDFEERLDFFNKSYKTKLRALEIFYTMNLSDPNLPGDDIRRQIWIERRTRDLISPQILKLKLQHSLEPNILEELRNSFNLEDKFQTIKPQFSEQSGDLNIGLELEVVDIQNKSLDEVIAFLKYFDTTMQLAGFKIGIDAIREVPLPVGNLYDLVKTLYELINLGLFDESILIGTHFNFEIPNVRIFILEILFIHLVFSVSGQFEVPNPDIDMPFHSIKQVEGNIRRRFPMGYPFRIKSDTLFEFRLMQGKSFIGEQYISGLTNLSYIMKIFKAYCRYSLYGNASDGEAYRYFRRFIDKNLDVLETHLYDKSHCRLAYALQDNLRLMAEYLSSMLFSRKYGSLKLSSYVTDRFDENVSQNGIFQALEERYGNGSDEFLAVWRLLNFSALQSNGEIMNYMKDEIKSAVEYSKSLISQ